jgi:FdhD protein
VYHLELMRHVAITKFDNGERLTRDDIVVEEYPLSIRVNGHKTASLLCSPSALRELVLGFLLSEGVIHGHDELTALQIDEERSVAEVTLVDQSIVPLQEQERTRSTGCGKGAIYLDVLTTCRRNDSPVSFSAESILDLSQRFNKQSDLFFSTGGVHSAALCSQEDMLFFYEDVGRHNAVDKIIGAADLTETGLNDKLLLCSGRISSEMLIKAAKRDIPLVVSRSAPTALAVELAQRLNITLVGFVRGPRMNIYSASHRITI